jgi:hypothetical protein
MKLKFVFPLALISMTALADTSKPTKVECEYSIIKSPRGSRLKLSKSPVKTLKAKLTDGRVIDEKLGKDYGDLTVYAYWNGAELSFGVEELNKEGEHSSVWSTAKPGAAAIEQGYYREVGDQGIGLSVYCSVK